MFAAPPRLGSTVVATLPAHLRSRGRVGPGHRLFRPGIDSFLEGPAFGPDGTLYMVDILNGRILRLAPDGGVETVAEYDGEPNGLAVHADGRLLIADHVRGLLSLASDEGQPTVMLPDLGGRPFHGLNDLVLARNGDLYFTDQGATDLQDPRGRLCRLTAGGQVDVLLDTVPSPNGVALSPDETMLFLAVTRANAVWRVPRSLAAAWVVWACSSSSPAAWPGLTGSPWTKRAAWRWPTRASGSSGSSAGWESRSTGSIRAGAFSRRTWPTRRPGLRPCS